MSLSDNRQRLFMAIRKGDIASLEACLKKGVPIDTTEPNDLSKWTPLHYASVDGKVEVAQLLLEWGATVDAQTLDGWTPLMLASTNFHQHTVNLLLKHRADLSVQNKDGDTALILACSRGHKEVVRLLLWAKADVNMKNKHGKTAMDVSRTDEIKEIIKTHIAAAAALERRDHHVDTNYPDIYFYGKPFEAAVTSEGQTVAFDDIGLTMTVPPRAVPEGTQLDLTVRPCVSGPFNLPKGYQPVSPAYLITASSQLSQEVQVSMEHYAELQQEEDCKNLVFLRASSTCSNHQYKFVEIPRKKFTFSVGNRRGVVSLKHFSLLWIVRVIEALVWGENAYSLRLYRSPNPSPEEVTAIFCVTLMQQLYIKNLESEIKCRFPEGHKATVEEPVYLYEDRVLVDIPSQIMGWSVEYDRSPEVTRYQMDLPLSNPDYKQFSSYPPKFHFRILPLAKEHTRATSCHFRLKGLKEAAEFTLFLPRTVTTPVSTSEVISRMLSEANDGQDGGANVPLGEGALPILLDVLQDVAVKWRDLGVYLGFSSGALNNIQAMPLLIIEGPCGFLRELLIQWLKWNESTVRNLVSALKRAGEKKKAFESGKALLLFWIATSTAKLNADPLPGVKPKTVEAYFQELEVLESRIVSNEPSASSLREAMEKMLTIASTENIATVQQDLVELNNKWEFLKTMAAERSSTLTAALERARSFNGKWKNEDGWLCDVERHVYGDWKPCGLPETCDDDITKHEAFLEEVQSHHDPIDALRDEGEELKGQGSPEEQKMVDQWVEDIVKRWEDLCWTLKDKKAQLQEAKGKAEEFNEAYLAVRDTVSHFEETQKKWEPIWSEVEGVKQQLETHNDQMKELTYLMSQLDRLEGLGHLLNEACVRSDGKVVLQRTIDLRSCVEALSSVAINRQSSLEKFLLSLGQFNAACDELWSWLRDALRQLDEAKPITGDLDAVASQLSRHKDLQKQLGAQMSSCTAVMKASQVLIKQITGEDKALLRKKLGEVEQEWERVYQVLLNRQDRLEQAHRHLTQFRSYLAPLQSWMTKVLPILDESEPVHGDIDLVVSLSAGHASFQKELISHQKSIDAANASGDHLVSEVLDDPTVTHRDLQELNEMWENICQKSVKKQESLDSAYEDMLDNLWQWVEEAEAKIAGTETTLIQNDLGALEQQLAEHDGFQKEMATHQLNMDALNKEKATYSHSNPEMAKRINNLFEHWQKLLLHSSERKHRLIEAHTRLKFDFETWSKQFLDWVRQGKLRVIDWFQKFDDNHDGILTREEFMKGLKASGLAVHQIELEMIADAFDQDHGDTIKLNKIMAILKGTHHPRREQMSDSEKIEDEILDEVSKCTCSKRFKVTRLGDGQYKFGDSQKRYHVRIPRNTVMVRLGAGWEPLADFLHKHDPCRDVRGMLTGKRTPGLTTAGFNSKRQTATAAKSTAMGRTVKMTKKLSSQPKLSPPDQKRPPVRQMQCVTSPDHSAVGQQLKLVRSTTPSSPERPAGGGVQANSISTPKE